MKRFLTLLSVIVLLAVLSPSASAQDENDFYAEQFKNSGADGLENALPDGTKAFFEENGIDPSDYNWVNGITTKNVFSHIVEFIRSGFKKPLKAGAQLTALIIIAAALAAAELKGSAANASLYAAALSAAAIVAVPTVQTVSACTDALKGVATFMLSFVPVFAVITAASGAAATSAAMSGLLLTAAEAVSYISGFAVMPLMGGYLALSICGSVSPLIKSSGIAGIIKRFSFWLSALTSTVFVGILSIQTAVNSSADTVVSKTAKFIIGSSVPLAGGALSEALGTVTASMTLLKSSVGIYGAVACCAVLLPLLTELLMWRAVFVVCAGVADMFSLPAISGLLRAVDLVFSVLAGLILLVGAVFVISLAVVVSAGKAQ